MKLNSLYTAGPRLFELGNFAIEAFFDVKGTSEDNHRAIKNRETTAAKERHW